MSTNELSNETLPDYIAAVDCLINKSYLSILGKEDLLSVQEEMNELTPSEKNKRVRFVKIKQFVINKNENIRDKLISVYNAVGSCDSSILYLLQGHKDSTASLYLGVSVKDKQNQAEAFTSLYKAQETLYNSIKGNFPGTDIERIRIEDIEKLYNETFKEDSYVTSISDVAGQRSEQENKDRNFVQGIEKFIDSMQGKEYSLLILANNKNAEEISKAKGELEALYSMLYPYANRDISLGKSQSLSWSESESKNKNSSRGTIANLIGSGVGALIGGIAGVATANPSAIFIGSQVGGAAGAIFGQNKSEGKTISVSSSESKNTSESTQIKFENHTIKRILAKIDELLKYYDKCSDIGMWDCAAYCISDKSQVAQSGASIYHSLIRGKASSIENSSLNLLEIDESKKAISYLKNMEHPHFSNGKMEKFLTPVMLISSAELAIQAGLPCHSVPGVPVLECAEFGREIAKYDDFKSEQGEISVGNYFYMNQADSREVKLDVKNFTSHTFITGSTGSGKSTAVYTLLSKLNSDNQCKFLVIEPAKGEYKDVFGHRTDVTVYSTNPNISKLIKINPFSFPKGITVTEHLERLIEIFNACWPMYAAMPQVLKDAVSKAYEDIGWNLITSENEDYDNDSDDAYTEKAFPSFSDVVRNIKEIINSSEYSKDTQGDYKGALETRLKSMTNGTNGQIFTLDEIPSEELFNSNCIIDLSRLGSTETKSLIMGILILKLQEYRMVEKSDSDSFLKHVTVLEEAHNLLKRTSTEQSGDSANLTGKSVEMITNAIAEMRTYGEGFIIADQAPGLLDMAVIRNTNTKIIMRLPDSSDRELVGKAANLNADQITELAKLPRGVAAIYQNEWIQPILCKIKKDENLNPRAFVPRIDDSTISTEEDNEFKIKIIENIFHENFEFLDDQEVVLDAYIYHKLRKLKNMYVKNEFVNENQKYLIMGEIYSLLLPETIEYLREKTSSDDSLEILIRIMKTENSISFSSKYIRDKVLSNIVGYYAYHYLQRRDNEFFKIL